MLVRGSVPTIRYFVTSSGLWGGLLLGYPTFLLTQPKLVVSSAKLSKEILFAYAMDGYVPDIEESIPLPNNAKEAFPELSPTEELNARAATIKFISDLTGQPIVPTKENKDEAEELAREMVANPQFRPEFANYPNETLAMLAGMVAQMNVSIVNDLADLKMYVVNNLVKEVETAKSAKERIAALSKLGEVDGVDAFKKRSETTVKIQTMEEVERELMATLEHLEDKVIDVKATEITDVEAKSADDA